MDGLFNYDRDMMEPPEEREELDPSEYIYVGCGQYRYVGDEIWLKNYTQKSGNGALIISILAESLGRLLTINKILF